MYSLVSRISAKPVFGSIIATRGFRTQRIKLQQHYEGTAGSLAKKESNYLGDSLSLDIETVPLVFDKYEPETPSQKKPIIVLHGLFGSKTNNRTVAKQVSRKLARDVYCLDLRNHGDSPHINRHDIPSLAADVERFVLEQRLVKPILVGHSMGAKTAMAITLRRPDMVSMVVPVDNAPIHIESAGGSTFGRYIQQLLVATERKSPPVKTMKEADAVLAQVEPVIEVRQFLLTNIKRRKDPKEGESHLVSKIPLKIVGKAIDNGNISAWPFDSDLVRWSGPALFVRGTKSTFVPDDVLPQIGKFFPRFEVRDIVAGHWVISEKPREFIDILCDWIEAKEEAEIEGDII